MNDILVWCVVGIVSLANIYIGRLFAVWDMPRMVVARPSVKVSAIAFSVMLLGAAFFISIQQSRPYSFSLRHAIVLSSAFGGSYLFFRSVYRASQPPVPWPDYLNSKVRAIIEVGQEHGWDLTSEGAVNRLAEADQLHFDEGDYDALVQSDSDREYEFVERVRKLAREEEPLRTADEQADFDLFLMGIPKTADGQPDYDRACAIRIVSLTASLAGSQHSAGVIAEVERVYDLSSFDRQAFQKLRWLAAGLWRQWGGHEGLYGPPRSKEQKSSS